MGLIVYMSLMIMKCDGDISIFGFIVEIFGFVFYIIWLFCSFFSVRKSVFVLR